MNNAYNIPFYSEGFYQAMLLLSFSSFSMIIFLVDLGPYLILKTGPPRLELAICGPNKL